MHDAGSSCSANLARQLYHKTRNVEGRRALVAGKSGTIGGEPCCDPLCEMQREEELPPEMAVTESPG